MPVPVFHLVIRTNIQIGMMNTMAYKWKMILSASTPEEVTDAGHSLVELILSK
jgi:hypothetical protein